MKGSRGFGWIIGGLLALTILTAGCALYRNDRAWVSDEQYALARQMYLQTGSLDLVQRRLADGLRGKCRLGRIGDRAHAKLPR